MKDPRIAKLISALSRRFPGTTIVTSPMPDSPGSGETMIQVLNAPMDPPSLVDHFAWQVIGKLWRDDWITVCVNPVSPEQSAKYYSQHVPKTRLAPPRRRRRAPAAAAR